MIANKSILGVWLQPASSLAGWAALGINVAVGYEMQKDGSGNPTVTMDQWDAAANAAGLYRIRTAGNLAKDATDPMLIGFDQADEIDGQVIGQPASVSEPIYALAESNYTAWKGVKPVYLNLDGNQVQYHLTDGSIDYARLLKCCDVVTMDYHPIQRGDTVANYQAILTKLLPVVAAAGKVFGFGLVEASDEHLDPTYYHSREPTPAEMQAEANIFQPLGYGVMFFTQSMGQDSRPNVDGSVGAFRYDNTSVATRTELEAICRAAPPIPVLPTVTVTVSAPGYTPASVTLSPAK